MKNLMPPTQVNRGVLFLFIGALFIFGPSLTGLLRAQSVSVDTLHKYGLYDTDRLPPSFHRDRRNAVREKMGSRTVALFLSAPDRARANDINYLYRQDANFYYLTGCLESHSALFISKSGMTMPDGETVHEVLFVQRRNPDEETWTGKRLGPNGAKSVLGFSYTLPIDSLPRFLKPYLAESDTLLFAPYDKQSTWPILDSTLLVWETVKEKLAQRYPNLAVTPPTGILARLREIKSPEEITLMRRAISISNEAHNEIMKKVRAGWHEYEMQALGEYIFAKNGAEYQGYPSIVGSGENSTILHYESNRRKTEAGDFVEMDMGAEYHGYSADVTRSFPVDGHFTQEQASIYDLVYEAQEAGIRAAKVGNGFRAPNAEATTVIRNGLLKLGIIKDSTEYRKYFMHGTSHYLGLDVHDAGIYDTLTAGNVITVEPGIYIKAGSPCDPKWWNIGCRIEDDILITANGPENLSAASPRKRSDVEKLMRAH